MESNDVCRMDGGEAPGSTPASTCSPSSLGVSRSTNDGTPQLKRRKMAAEASKAFRRRIKEDKERYRAHRECENTRVKLYMTQMTDEKKAAYRETTKRRLQTWRAEQKAKGKYVSTYVAPKTQIEKERMQGKWREQKARQRARKTDEEKELEGQRRRTQYKEKALKRAAEQNSTSSSSSKQPEQNWMYSLPLQNKTCNLLQQNWNPSLQLQTILSPI